MRHAISILSLTVVFWCAQEASAAAPSLPDEANFVPTLMKFYNPPAYEPWNELSVPRYDGKVLTGKHWSVVGYMDGIADSFAAWNIVKPAFLAHGWTLAVQNPRGGQLYETLHFTQKGTDVWANVEIPDARHVLFDFLQPGPLPYTLTLAAPQPTPERVDVAKDEFPYLTGLPGSKFGGGSLDNVPLSVPVAGTDQQELVATSVVDKWYPRPDGLNNALFLAEYHGALAKAGWVIVKQFSSADAGLLAHYARQRRNIWASLHINNGRYDIVVADAGAKDLGSALTTDCHIALYGVFFDFNKATLKPESDPVLQQALGILKSAPSLNIEVQGHTDNVGSDAYNQTLSESRAASVMAWLTQHGIAKGRLTSKGYGKTRPVADNNTDDGRAKNRRVEIADPRCTPKAK